MANHRRLTGVWTLASLPTISCPLLSRGERQSLLSVDLRKAFNKISIRENDIRQTRIPTAFILFEFALSSQKPSLDAPTHHGLSPVGVLVSAVLFGLHVCDLRWGRRFWTGPFHLISGNPNKWMLERNEVEYLGYIVSLEGIRPPSHKLKKEDFPRQVVAAELNCRNAYFLSPLHSEYFWHIRSAKWASQDSTRQR